jgi:Family of unknown function (DUF5313)
VCVVNVREHKPVRPPFMRWLWYGLGGKLPVTWHDWMRADLNGRWFWLRNGLRRQVVIISVLVISRFAMHRPYRLAWWLWVLAGLLVLSAATARVARSQTWRRNGYTKDGDLPLAPTPPVPYQQRQLPPSPSHLVAPSLRIIGPIMIVGAVGWLYGAAFPHESMRVFGLSFQHDPNSPVSPATVGTAAAVAVAAALVAGLLVAGKLRRHGMAGRPPLDPKAPGRRRWLYVAAFAFTTIASLIAATGMYPAMASAALGAALLAVGTCCTVVGWHHRRSTIAWADVLNRPPQASLTA